MTNPEPVPTAIWLARFQTDMRALNFTDDQIGPLLPVVLQHLLTADDLMTGTE